MNKKAVIELSANFLVIMIISLALFGMGMFMFTKVIDTSQDMELDLTTSMRKQLDAAMDDGSLVVIPQQRLNGYEGDRVIFSIGILNDFDYEERFDIRITSITVDGGGNPYIEGGNSGQSDNDIQFIQTIQDLPSKDKFHSIIAIDIPIGTPKGQYGFNVKVTHSSTLQNYAPMQRIYVVVL